MPRAALLLLVLVLAGCGGEAAGGGPRVVATTTQLADMARNVAPGADVRTLLAANADPHAYEVRPHDVKALAHADVVLRSGGEADEWLDGALDSAGVEDSAVVDAGAAAGIVGEDPHWWQDPRRAERAVTAIGRAIPGGDAAPYVRRLRALDAAVERCLRTVPAERAAARDEPRRARLLRAPLRHRGRRHGDPGAHHGAQPSAGDVARLVDTIRRAGVRTIFAESSVSPKVEQAIAHEAGARVGRRAVGRLARAEGEARPTSARSRPTRARSSRASRRAVDCPSMPDLGAPYIQRGIVEMLLLAVLAGVLGTWVVLRRLPFFTHAVGTATFPGLVVAGPWGVPAQLTALVCAVGFGGVLERVQRTRRIDPDAAIGLLLVAALAIGVVLASTSTTRARGWTGCCSAR